MSEPSVDPLTTSEPKTERESKPRKRGVGSVKTIIGAVIGAITALFAFINLDKVDVNYLVGSAQTPLIIVIAISMLVGIAIDRMLVVSRRKK